MSHAASYKQYASHRGSDGADGQVHDHHNTELDGIHAQVFHHRKEDWSEDQKGRRHIHKGSHDQQDQVDNQEDDDFVVRYAKHQVADGLRQSGKAEYETEYGGGPDDQHHNGGHYCRVRKNSHNLGRLNTAVDKNSQDKGIDYRNAGGFRGRKFAGQNAADNDNDQKQTGDGIPDSL